MFHKPIVCISGTHIKTCEVFEDVSGLCLSQYNQLYIGHPSRLRIFNVTDQPCQFYFTLGGDVQDLECGVEGDKVYIIRGEHWEKQSIYLVSIKNQTTERWVVPGVEGLLQTVAVSMDYIVATEFEYGMYISHIFSRDSRIPEGKRYHGMDARVYLSPSGYLWNQNDVRSVMVSKLNKVYITLELQKTYATHLWY